MTLTLADYAAGLVLSAVSAALGAYLGAYLRRKGENVATREDFARILEQTKLTASATESIRADLTGKAWVSQEIWRRKVELYSKLLTMLDGMANDSDRLVRALKTDQVPPGAPQSKPLEHLQEIMVMMQIVAPHVVGHLQRVTELRKDGEDPLANAEHSRTRYREAYWAVAREARLDLGLETGLEAALPRT